MVRVKRAGIITMVMICILLLISASNSYGVVYTLPGKLNESISSIEWRKSDWIKEHSKFNTAANNGIKLWEDSSSVINFTGVAPSGTLDEIRFFASSNEPDSNGWTKLFQSKPNATDPDVTGSSKNWDYAKIYFQISNINARTQAKANIVAGHEIGHALSLFENNQTKSYITCQEFWGRTATKPHSDEVAKVKAKHGK